ncbi:SRPBCC family protein [Methylopila sp. 73B]|uniref:SRPBCC family protein n=1 Tax=Methylopila sp. 73B TaxID=1120792 RepID=UPI000364545A|nr:SRPBCC family protein [Methylopila sp. 73B]
MRTVTLFGAGVAAALAFGSANAAEVTRSIDIAAPAKKVWTTASPDFCGIGTFHPAIEKCVLADGGKTRTLSLKGGGTIVEKRLSWSAKTRSYSYAIMESPLPVADYKSTFTVKADGKKGSTVLWTSTFTPKGASEADAKKAIDGIYSSGLDALKAKL